MPRYQDTAAASELATLRLYVQRLIVEQETLKELIEVLRIRCDYWRKIAKGEQS